MMSQTYLLPFSELVFVGKKEGFLYLKSVEASFDCLVKVPEAAYGELVPFYSGLSVGERVKDRRSKMGFDQGVLSKQAGISQSMLSEIEKHDQSMTVNIAKKISSVLKVPLGFFA